MNPYSVYTLILQLLSLASVTATSVSLINSMYVLILEQRNNGNFTNISMPLAIVLICFGDSISNGPYTSQYRPASGTFECNLEGFLHQLGYMITWTFTFYIACILYSTTVLEKIPVHYLRHFLLCIGLPVTLVGIQSHIGFAQYDLTPFDICLYSYKTEGQLIYHYISFWGLLSMICLSMLAMRLHQFILEWQNDRRTTSNLFIRAKHLLQYYPAVLIICWIPTAIMISSGSKSSEGFNIFAVSFKIVHGLIISAVYFRSSNQPCKYFWRSLSIFAWYHLLFCEEDLTSELLDTNIQFSMSNLSMSKFSISKLSPNEWNDSQNRNVVTDAL